MKATESDDSESEEENKLKIRKSVNSEETKPKLDKSKSEEPEDEVSFYWKTLFLCGKSLNLRIKWILQRRHFSP